MLRDNAVLDDLWSWQAEIWTDFCALAIVLSLNELNEAELISQSPIVWKARPLTTGGGLSNISRFAIFWLRETKRIVEVQLCAHKENWLGVYAYEQQFYFVLLSKTAAFRAKASCRLDCT